MVRAGIMMTDRMEGRRGGRSQSQSQSPEPELEPETEAEAGTEVRDSACETATDPIGISTGQRSVGQGTSEGDSQGWR